MSNKNGAGSSKSIPSTTATSPPSPTLASHTPGPPRISCINTYLNNHCLRLGRIIGEGSYSKVRLCTHKNPTDGSERKIACKIIDKQKASGDFVNKFLPRELEIVSRLKNPNIISVYDVVDFNDHVFIFMDFCNRGDLLEYIKLRGFLSERRSKYYFYQLLSAVRYLHGLDLAHRDLKCENILLTHNDLVKISDFGFSRYCHDAFGKRILSNTYCGSAAYAAPEILQGTMYNPKLYDMWSLGCILFIMLTGHMPFDETDIPGMLDNQLKKVLPYPQHVAHFIGDTAKQLIRHLLEPDVTRRATIEQAISDVWFTESDSTGGGDYQSNHEQTPTYSDAPSIGPIEMVNPHEIVIGGKPKPDMTISDGNVVSGQRPTSSSRCGSSRQSNRSTRTSYGSNNNVPSVASATYRPGTPYPNAAAVNQYIQQPRHSHIPRTGPDRCGSTRMRNQNNKITVEELTQQVEELRVPRSSTTKKASQTYKRK